MIPSESRQERGIQGGILPFHGIVPIGPSNDVIAFVGPKTRGRPKKRSDQQQIDIIAAEAIVLFLDRGFAAMRMDDVAAACKVSKRTLYRLFPSKLDLFRALVILHRQTMVDVRADLVDLPMDQALSRLLQIDRGPEADHHRMQFLHRVLLETKAIPELGEILFRDGIEPATAQLAGWFVDRKSLDGAHIGDPAAAASMLMNMMFGVITLTAMEASYYFARPDREAYLAECIRYFVHGVK